MIFLVSGKAYSGKGTVTAALLQLPTAKELSFAAGVKKYAIEYFSVPVHECYNSYEEAVRAGYTDTDPALIYGKTPHSRMVLQGLGGMVREHFDVDHWAKQAAREVTDDDLLASVYEPDYIFSDWRYPNEYEVIKQEVHNTLSRQAVRQKVITIRVIRNGNTKPIEFGADHHSETSLSDEYVIPQVPYDKVFYNNGTIEQLQEEVRQWLRELGKIPKESTQI